jgi:hypothetical protein
LTEELGSPARARLLDLFRPAQLFARLDARPTFFAATLVVVLCVVVYTATALGPAMPTLSASLLPKSQWTESELESVLRGFFLAVALALPLVFLLVTALASWGLLAATGSRRSFLRVLSLTAHASLWLGLGFLAKALLVIGTGRPEPPVNLGLLVQGVPDPWRVVLAFTNPFLLLALVWSVRGLRAWGTRLAAALAGGALPWAAWTAAVAVAGGGAGGRFAPATPVPVEDWQTLENATVTLRHPPALRDEVSNLATTLDGFARQLAEQFGFEARSITVQVYPDHATLERATGEFLHVRVTGSIRGRELLYLEIPGRNAAVAQEAGLRDAVRYMALMQLAPVAPGAPRWFVEGVAHAAAFPYSPALEREYQSALRKTGVPSIDALFDERIYRTPEGPVLARSLVDFIAWEHGRDAPADILRDVKSGTPFRDALFARTRLTTGELEKGWQEVARTALGIGVPPAAADSADSAGVPPFRPRR